MNSKGQSWLIHEDSIDEIGCIHTCQGLEVQYIGVIIGLDLVLRNNKVETDPSKRAQTDKSLNGLKQLEKLNKQDALFRADQIIKNTYRTLMSRGQKGCFIYCCDKKPRTILSKSLKIYLLLQSPKLKLTCGRFNRGVAV